MSNAIKQQLIKAAGLMYDRGLVNTYEGNISVLDEQKVYITPSATCKGFLTEEMIVVTDMDGIVLEGFYKPSTEIKLHLAAYRLRPGIKSVAHAHSPYATGYAIANRPIESKAYPELIAIFGKIPLVKYGTPSTDEVWMDLGKYISEYDTFLLANHGVLSVGLNAMDAFFKLEAAESIAKTLTIAAQLGGETELPLNKLNELNNLKKNKAEGK